MTTYHANQSAEVDPAPWEPPVEDDATRKARQDKNDQERKEKQQAWEELMGVMVKEAANIISGPMRDDVGLTIEGAIITVLAANRAGNHDQWVIAVDALGDILKTIAQRESRMIHEATVRRELEGQGKYHRGSPRR